MASGMGEALHLEIADIEFQDVNFEQVDLYDNYNKHDSSIPNKKGGFSLIHVCICLICLLSAGLMGGFIHSLLQPTSVVGATPFQDVSKPKIITNNYTPQPAL